MPFNPKELHYFDNAKRFGSLKFDEYLEYFGDAQPDTVAIGEATAGYLWASKEHDDWGSITDFRAGMPGRVRETLREHTKLIAILRNPIDRALSAFTHHKRKQRIAEVTCSPIGPLFECRVHQRGDGHEEIEIH